ncbi:AGE family epimerase/isomerase [Alicyclobacillus fastidiosus]|uniref:AGE family epimerase/isomerase n=1 Tax=Alicyclobacillus fastidiosus TaxID=392011 RepID=A0ABV5AEK9_9BACL|nr:AGE family epimerase/isomerase [Alicyclobacillus fastidiosus]WEH09751.1 AGE family epimerase/isomerase [Alicyclobacillus fastidiosus]
MSMHPERTSAELLHFYKRHLNEVLLPFWQGAVDRNYGGVFTCFNNMGTTLVSRDKYVWSQGRFVWLWSKIADMCQRGVLDDDAGAYLEQARKTAVFLKRRAILDNGNCAYLLMEEGDLKEAIPGQGHDISFFVDCFVVLGFAGYAKAAGDAEVLEWALSLCDRIFTRVRLGGLRSEPYPVPEGLRAHSIPMILLHVAQELTDALQAFHHDRASEFADWTRSFAEEILGTFLQPDGSIAEMIPVAANQFSDTVLTRHVNPGHTIECMWFILHAAGQLDRTDWIPSATNTVKRAFEMGWDAKCGGLLRFVDQDGGPPRGQQTGDAYEQLILDTWDTKLWWPHSEALYTTLLSYHLTQDAAFKQLYEQTHDYVFQTFPNPDTVVGEWIQIRDRQGQPVDKLVALPVKDPYHIIRNVLLTIELLHVQVMAS